ncbi:MAG: PD-(D/E)XK nuclease family protein, partial [Clostridia bacterium]|nr:PD-(D/E)XK nuclease family protein [Clostridia bacterium]
ERIMRSECVFREKSFIIRKSVCDFDPSLPRRFADENAVVRGRIDLVFIEDGKAVVVDYKTDRVNDLSELIERYGEQMELYSDAVEKAFGYEVKERILYSLTKRDFIGV